MLTSLPESTNWVLLNISGHGLAVGDSVNLHFTSGGASNAVYQVVWSTNNNWFAVITADPIRRSGNAYFTGGASDGVTR
jgi:hypothetical protein